MKFLKKLKSGNFWISLISAGVLIAEGIFDFEIKTEYLNQILLGLMGILTLFGIVTDHGDTSVILNTATSTENNQEDTKTESTTSNVSNIKSICDTVSLLLNKVSINSNLDIENVTDIINEVKEINEALHKETEKVEQTSNKEENNQTEEVVEIENKEKEVAQETIAETIEEKQKIVEDTKTEEVIVDLVEEDKVTEVEQSVKIEENPKTEQVENVIINPAENEIQEISIVNN